MAILSHILGFPRIGSNRELKKAQEQYWNGKIQKKELLNIGSQLRQDNWKKQKESGIDYISVGDFAWYDHVLNTSMMLGNIPERYRSNDNHINLDILFGLAKGISPDISACEMTKWFNTNYHYIVPEFTEQSNFTFSWKQILEEVDEALLLGYKVKPILLGPITYLWLGKVKGKLFDRLDLLDKIIPIYQDILKELCNRGIKLVQIDEPILVLDLPKKWQRSYQYTYSRLCNKTKLLLTTYFSSISHNLDWICKLPVQGIHIDLIYGKYNIFDLNNYIPKDWILSLGIINGRNIWRSDLIQWFDAIITIVKNRKKLLISSSCSLLHVPIDLELETKLDNEVKSWFSFAIQKCSELSLLCNALNNNDYSILKNWTAPIYARRFSKHVHKKSVQERLSNILPEDYNRINTYKIRSQEQIKKFQLPVLPTTTIGSFPQTKNIRQLRNDLKQGLITKKEYELNIKKNIKKAISIQEELDIDVLVHGEFERNDMVEYFGECLDGFVFTEHAWVQSYGSRCVKPPIIIGDISRHNTMTVKWSQYAQSLTNHPVKGMLTGPVTILFWSFPREDISLKKISEQIALALRDEVKDLEKANIDIIQIDEPALREGLPLRKELWNEYLSWAVNAFRLSSSGVKNSTQIHTHMCYCEFNDIISSIALLDADVITIEASRSDMELLEAFKNFQYPNDIGPGIYDIHSSNIPSIEEMKNRLLKAMNYIPLKRLWINPDCGLKTRSWEETILSLQNMMTMTKQIRTTIDNS